MTKEEAIKALQIHMAYMPMYSMPKTKEALDMAVAALSEQDFNANQHVSNTSNALGGWISVEERLPEEDSNVLAYVHGFFGTCVEVVCWDSAHSLICRDVTHWMPLPEPPEVEG